MSHGFTSFVLLKAKFNEINIKKIVEKSLSKGFKYNYYYNYQTDKYETDLNKEKIAEILLNKNEFNVGSRLSSSFKKNQILYATFDIRKRGLDVFSVSLKPDGGQAWYKDFIIGDEKIDLDLCIRTLLEVTQNFLVSGVTALSLDVDQLEIWDATTSRINSQYHKNRIYIGTYWIDKEAFELIIINAKKNNYFFYSLDDLDKQLNDEQINNLMMDAFNNKSKIRFIIKFDNFYSQIEIEEDWIFSIKPLESFKIKITEDAQGIDLAFYTKILLNMLDGIAIYELESTFSE